MRVGVRQGAGAGRGVWRRGRWPGRCSVAWVNEVWRLECVWQVWYLREGCDRCQGPLAFLCFTNPYLEIWV